VRATEVWSRLDDRIAGWGVAVERLTETENSVLAFGRRDGQPVVVKIIKSRSDEWKSGQILDAFEGRGVVRVHDSVDGALLLERLIPGDSLVGMAVNESDDTATAILAATIGRMSPREVIGTVPTAKDWGMAFERYRASHDDQVPVHLLSHAERLYADLCESQTRVRLLHGDLHHDNVILDHDRGWLAIDPKGVIAEPEYEVGAALRNPFARPGLFADPATIRRRVDRFAADLALDAARVLLWAFAQGVLSALWTVEDGFEVTPDHNGMVLATAIASGIW
jgi:streptomycin 6-kinase